MADNQHPHGRLSHHPPPPPIPTHHHSSASTNSTHIFQGGSVTPTAAVPPTRDRTGSGTYRTMPNSVMIQAALAAAQGVTSNSFDGSYPSGSNPPTHQLAHHLSSPALPTSSPTPHHSSHHSAPITHSGMPPPPPPIPSSVISPTSIPITTPPMKTAPPAPSRPSAVSVSHAIPPPLPSSLASSSSMTNNPTSTTTTTISGGSSLTHAPPPPPPPASLTPPSVPSVPVSVTSSTDHPLPPPPPRRSSFTMLSSDLAAMALAQTAQAYGFNSPGSSATPNIGGAGTSPASGNPPGAGATILNSNVYNPPVPGASTSLVLTSSTGGPTGIPGASASVSGLKVPSSLNVTQTVSAASTPIGSPSDGSVQGYTYSTASNAKYNYGYPQGPTATPSGSSVTGFINPNTSATTSQLNISGVSNISTATVPTTTVNNTTSGSSNSSSNSSSSSAPSISNSTAKELGGVATFITRVGNAPTTVPSHNVNARGSFIGDLPSIQVNNFNNPHHHHHSHSHHLHYSHRDAGGLLPSNQGLSLTGDLPQMPQGARVVLPRFPDPDVTCNWDTVDSPDFWKDLQKVRSKTAQFTSRVKNDFAACANGLDGLLPHQIMHYRDSLATVCMSDPSSALNGGPISTSASAPSYPTQHALSSATSSSSSLSTTTTTTTTSPEGTSVPPSLSPRQRMAQVPDEVSRLLAQLGELHASLASAMESAAGSEKYTLAYAHELMERHSEYDTAKAKYLEKQRAFLQLKPGTDPKKIKSKQEKLAYAQHTLEVKRFDMYAGLDEAHNSCPLFLLQPLAQRLNAYKVFFSAGHDLFSTFAETIDALSNRVSEEMGQSKTRSKAHSQVRNQIVSAAPPVPASLLESSSSIGGVGGLFGSALNHLAGNSSTTGVTTTTSTTSSSTNLLSNSSGLSSSTAYNMMSNMYNDDDDDNTDTQSIASTVVVTGIRDLDQRRGNRTTATEKRGYLFYPPPNQLRMWCELKDGTLIIMDPKGAPPVTLPMMLCTVKQSRDSKFRNVFSVISPQTTVNLQAESESQMNDWLDTIQNAISAGLNQGNSGVSSGGSGSSSSGSTSSAVGGFGGGRAHLGNANSPGGSNTGSGNGSQGSGTDGSPTSLQQYQQKLTQVAGNGVCADCGAASPDWLSLNLSVLICLECSGVHRSLGVQVSKVRSLTMDSIDKSNLTYLHSMGNEKANAVWEAALQETKTTGTGANTPSPMALLKPKPDSPRNMKQLYIQSKYIDKAFIIDDLKTLPNADPDVAKQHRAKRMFDAVQRGNIVELYRQIVHGAQPQWTLDVSEGRNAVHEAIMYNRLDLAVLAMHFCGDLTVRDFRGWTCLHYAAYANDPALAEACFAFGGVQLSSITDNAGQTPEQLAITCNTGPEFAANLPLLLEVLKNAAIKYAARLAKG